MKYLLIFLLSILASTNVLAQSCGEFVLMLRDGSQESIYLNDEPKVSFKSEHLYIQTNKTSYQFSYSDIQRYYFKDVAASDVNLTAKEQEIIREGDAIKVRTAKAGEKVTIVNTAGIVVATATTNNSGLAVFSLRSLPSGIYVVNYLNNSIKITKQ